LITPEFGVCEMKEDEAGSVSTALWKRAIRVLVERNETVYNWLAFQSDSTNWTRSWRSSWKMEQSSTQTLWKVSTSSPLSCLSDILSHWITSFHPTPCHVPLN